MLNLSPHSQATATEVTVSLAERSYPILIGENVLADCAQSITQQLGKVAKAILITDTHVGAHYQEAVVAALHAQGIAVENVMLPAGEGSKSFQQLEYLLDAVLASGVERATPLIALGGGVIGDLVGFAASMALRGVPFIQIPTSLLAQVDSSVGGKTAINSPHGKNLIGAFYQPSLVLADMNVLRSLPQRELLSGYAEVVKYGLLGDAAFFAWLENHAEAALRLETPYITEAVAHCCRMKAAIVSEDERERGKRALLNLGHTFGHALEKATRYSDALTHGESVAIGCMMAFALSVERGHCPAEDLERVKAHFEIIGLPTNAAHLDGLDAATLAGYCYQDKKVAGGKLTFILVNGIGDAFVTQEITLDEVTRCFARHLQAGV